MQARKKNGRPCMRQFALDGKVLFPAYDQTKLAVVIAAARQGQFPLALGCSLDEGGWVVASPERTKETFEAGNVVLVVDGKCYDVPLQRLADARTSRRERPSFKRHASERRTSPASLSTLLADTPLNTAGTKEIGGLLGRRAFDYPKPVGLIATLLRHMPQDAVVLDFFAGSGTTAHAVAELNAEDGGQRRCILVTSNEGDIARAVTRARVAAVLSGQWAEGAHDPLPGRLRYLRVEHVERVPDEEAMAAATGHGVASLVALREDAWDVAATDEHSWWVLSDGSRRAVAVCPDGDWWSASEAAGALAAATAAASAVYLPGGTRAPDATVAALFPGAETASIPDLTRRA